MLLWLNYADPAVTQSEVAESEPLRESGLDLLVTWYETYGDKSKRLNEIRKEGEGTPVFDCLATNKYDFDPTCCASLKPG
jgi:hypothetical protein